MTLYNWAFLCAHFLMHSISFELCIWNPHEKIADPYLFLIRIYAPFLSYGPLKKYGWNLFSKLSKNLLKLEP